MADINTNSTTDTGRPTPPPARWRYRAYSVAIALTVLLIWELAPAYGLIHEIILRRFSDTAWALWTLVHQEFFMRHLTVTVREIMIGFLLGSLNGFVLGIALAVWPGVKRVLYPFIVSFQSIPKIVFAPLFVAWFGFGETSKVVMAVVISFFPVLINTMVGLESVPKEARTLMRSLRASPMQTFWKVSLPHALPIISAGLKAALTFAVIGAIVGEFVGASVGLGFLLEVYNQQLRIDRVYAVIIVLASIGAFGYFVLEWLDNKIIFWRDDSNL